MPGAEVERGKVEEAAPLTNSGQEACGLLAMGRNGRVPPFVAFCPGYSGTPVRRGHRSGRTLPTEHRRFL